MIVLSLIFCLSAAPSICQKVSPQEYTSGIACLLEAQEQAARWQNEHPSWRLAAFRCGPAQRET
jgi:hypothetical protein